MLFDSTLLQGVYQALYTWLLVITEFILAVPLFHSPPKPTKVQPAPRDASQPDVVIVGSGIAGSALAYLLGKEGRRVMVIERDLSEPDRIVGELLQPGGVELLQQMGLSQDLFDDIDSPKIEGYAVFHEGKPIQLKYPLGENDAKVLGRSFHHGRFVMKLRKAASEQTTVSMVEGTVVELLRNNDRVTGVSYRVKGDSESRQIQAPLVVVCDGLFSRFRKELVPSSLEAKSHFVGIVIKDLDLPFKNHGHVVLANPAPVLMYPISSTEVRCLVDIPSPLPDDIGGFLINQTAPQLPDFLRAGFIRAVEEGPLRSMPCGRIHPTRQSFRGVVLIGDAFNVRHPLTGGGMTVALSDCTIINELLSQVSDWDNVDQVSELLESQFYRARQNRASVINVLAQALYDVFSGRGEELGAMQKACFEFFNRGGSGVQATIGLLGALNTSPLSLVYHFFHVGLIAMFSTLKPYPTPAKIAQFSRIAWVSASLILPLLCREQVIPFVAPMQSLPADKSDAAVQTCS